MGERRITTISGDIRAIGGTTIEAFATQLRGKLLTGDDDGYDTARKVWNGLVDKRPFLNACKKKSLFVVFSEAAPTSSAAREWKQVR